MQNLVKDIESKSMNISKAKEIHGLNIYLNENKTFRSMILQAIKFYINGAHDIFVCHIMFRWK